MWREYSQVCVKRHYEGVGCNETKAQFELHSVCLDAYLNRAFWSSEQSRIPLYPDIFSTPRCDQPELSLLSYSKSRALEKSCETHVLVWGEWKFTEGINHSA